MRFFASCLAVSLLFTTGCKNGTEIVTSTIGNMIYGGLSEMGDTSRPANERRAAAMIEGTEYGADFGRAIQSQLPE